MISKLETAKLLVTTMTALNNRWVKTSALRDLAIKEDMENRQKLMDPALSSDDFTRFSTLARAAQRRRANLHDKLIEIEESFRAKATELQLVGTEMFTERFVMPSVELAEVDAEYLEKPEEVVEGEVFVDPEAPAEEAA